LLHGVRKYAVICKRTMYTIIIIVIIVINVAFTNCRCSQ
jgi:uncharacterized integral membrane protein